MSGGGRVVVGGVGGCVVNTEKDDCEQTLSVACLVNNVIGYEKP